MDPLDLGRCTNPKCGIGCGIFVPNPSGDPGEHPALIKCAICTCVAGQHIKQTDKPAPAPTPAPSATHSSIFGSRSYVPASTAAAGGTTENLSGPFRSATQKRDEKLASQLPHPLNTGPGNPFNPAAQDRYRRPGPDKLLSLSERQYVQKIVLPKDSTPASIHKAVLTVYEHIPAVSEYDFRVLRVKRSPYTTQRGRQSKRVEFRLRPSAAELDLESLIRATTLTAPPGAKGFKNIIYIALKPAGPNLPFPDSDTNATFPMSDQESRVGGASDDSSDSDESMVSVKPEGGNVNTEGGREHTTQGSGSREVRILSPDPVQFHLTLKHQPSADAQKSDSDSDFYPPSIPKGKEKDQWESPGDSKDHTSFPSENFSFNGDDDFDAEDTLEWDPYPAVHRELVRLLQNMTKPDNIKDLNWWKTTTMDHLRSFNDLLPLLTEILDLAASAQIPVDLCFDKLKKHILAPLDRIRILAGSVDYPDEKNPANGLKDFDSLIAVGPGGITTVLPAFDAVYRGLDVLRSTRAFTAKAQIVQSEIRQMSGSLLSCVRHLRTHLFRGVFDPKGGFRELAVLLESPAAARILPVGKPKSHMVETIDLIDLKWDSPFSLTTSLASAFGDASDPRKMLSEIVCQGEFGLEYFYSRIVAPFLDEVERTEYQEISNILCKCCLALARKVSNRLKVPVLVLQVLPQILNKAVRDRSGHFKSTAKHDPAMDEYFPWWRKVASDSDEDLTNTDSMDGDEWWKAPKEGPDIKARRSRRHPHNISSDSDAAPSARKRKYTAKSPPQARPRPRPKPVWVDVDSPIRAKPETEPETPQQKDIREATALAKSKWVKLVPKILSRFPHPDTNKRVSLANFSAADSDKAMYRRLSHIYHPDKNVNESSHWQQVTALIAAALNANFHTSR
ncbi:hypothetical protein B0H19DRAFT_1072094 [Mycena capillaripes]|nr:hypothetical protein B0H19DRAFT_1072094 [Mycena capillaripes]